MLVSPLLYQQKAALLPKKDLNLPPTHQMTHTAVWSWVSRLKTQISESILTCLMQEFVWGEVSASSLRVVCCWELLRETFQISSYHSPSKCPHQWCTYLDLSFAKALSHLYVTVGRARGGHTVGGCYMKAAPLDLTALFLLPFFQTWLLLVDN